jgi:hypothetical protein
MVKLRRRALAYLYFEDEPGAASCGSPDYVRRGVAYRRQHRQAARAIEHARREEQFLKSGAGERT